MPSLEAKISEHFALHSTLDGRRTFLGGQSTTEGVSWKRTSSLENVRSISCDCKHIHTVRNIQQRR